MDESAFGGAGGANDSRDKDKYASLDGAEENEK
jgi:hypothetical protein